MGSQVRFIMFVVLVFILTNTIVTANEDVFCKNIDIVKHNIETEEFFVNSSEGFLEKWADIKNSLVLMLGYLNAQDEASDCTGTNTENGDFCTHYKVVEEDIEDANKNIEANEHAVARHKANLAKLYSQLQFFNSFDPAASCSATSGADKL